jgi:hypothetical protein
MMERNRNKYQFRERDRDIVAFSRRRNLFLAGNENNKNIVCIYICCDQSPGNVKHHIIVVAFQKLFNESLYHFFFSLGGKLSCVIFATIEMIKKML